MVEASPRRVLYPPADGSSRKLAVRKQAIIHHRNLLQQSFCPGIVLTPSFQDSPSISPYRPLSLSEDTLGVLGSRMLPSTIVPSPPLQSIPQVPPVEDDNPRVRHRGLHGQSQLRPHRVGGDQPGLSGNDDRMRRTAGSTRLRQSPRDNDRQQSQRDQAYGPRVPFWRPGQRQSLYDWAPATPPEEEFESRLIPPLIDGGELDDEILGDAPLSHRAYSPSPPLSGSPSRTRIHREPSTNIRMYENLFGTSIDPLFRPTPVQPSRQNPRRPVRSRPQWHSWSWEREREREARDDASRSRSEWRDAETMLRPRPFRTRSENRRDLSSSSASSYELEEVIKYLAKLRTSSGPEESLRLAVKAGFNRGDDWLEVLDDESRYDDLLLDTHSLHVAETSWLKVGGVFWGSQTTPLVVPAVHQRSAVSSASSTSSLPSNTTGAAASYPDESRRTSRASSHYINNPHQWTVKVIISSIDYSQLRLSKCIALQKIYSFFIANRGQFPRNLHSRDDGSLYRFSKTCF